MNDFGNVCQTLYTVYGPVEIDINPGIFCNRPILIPCCRVIYLVFQKKFPPNSHLGMLSKISHLGTHPPKSQASGFDPQTTYFGS